MSIPEELLPKKTISIGNTLQNLYEKLPDI